MGGVGAVAPTDRPASMNTWGKKGKQISSCGKCSHINQHDWLLDSASVKFSRAAAEATFDWETLGHVRGRAESMQG